MPYVIPTAEMLKAKYPAFAAVPDATVNLYIADAQVDDSWFEDDYQAAIMLWAAWAMTDFGIGTGGELAGYTGAGVSRLKSGTLDVSFSDNAGSASGYATNIYGRAYYDLLRKNKGGPRVIGAAVGCRSGWAKDWPVGTGGDY